MEDIITSRESPKTWKSLRRVSAQELIGLLLIEHFQTLCNQESISLDRWTATAIRFLIHTVSQALTWSLRTVSNTARPGTSPCPSMSTKLLLSPSGFPSPILSSQLSSKRLVRPREERTLPRMTHPLLGTSSSSPTWTQPSWSFWLSIVSSLHTRLSIETRRMTFTSACTTSSPQNGTFSLECQFLPLSAPCWCSHIYSPCCKQWASA